MLNKKLKNKNHEKENHFNSRINYRYTFNDFRSYGQ